MRERDRHSTTLAALTMARPANSRSSSVPLKDLTDKTVGRSVAAHNPATQASPAKMDLGIETTAEIADNTAAVA